jgi:hypothetical protein
MLRQRLALVQRSDFCRPATREGLGGDNSIY